MPKKIRCPLNTEKIKKLERPSFSDGGGDSDSGAVGEIRTLASTVFHHAGHSKIKLFGHDLTE